MEKIKPNKHGTTLVRALQEARATELYVVAGQEGAGMSVNRKEAAFVIVPQLETVLGVQFSSIRVWEMPVCAGGIW